MLSVIVSVSFTAPAKAVVVINLPSLEALLMQILGENVKEVKNMLDQIKELKNQLAQLTKLNDQLKQSNGTLGTEGTPKNDTSSLEQDKGQYEENNLSPEDWYKSAPKKYGAWLRNRYYPKPDDKSGLALEAFRDIRSKDLETIIHRVLNNSMIERESLKLMDENYTKLVLMYRKSNSIRDDLVVNNVASILQMRNLMALRNSINLMNELHALELQQQLPVSFTGGATINNTNK